jgi:hypothetical protein
MLQIVLRESVLHRTGIPYRFCMKMSVRWLWIALCVVMAVVVAVLIYALILANTFKGGI